MVLALADLRNCHEHNHELSAYNKLDVIRQK